MFAGLGTRVRTFWQDQRAAFARLVARDPSINREATATHYAAVFRRERDEALAELNRLRDSDRQAAAWLQNAQQRVDTALVQTGLDPRRVDNDIVRWTWPDHTDDLWLAGAVEFRNLDDLARRVPRRRPTTYRDTEQEDL